ncbi:hypothetical protein [Flavobacterium sp. AG291]|uniref:hypothetical protein n=1 Tax=Flavobacterium sp. AG291 TaxID=2184000 RepID=UPI000E0B7044|nr:hypothetical protein [Flavobacterium sp. AG291]RDI07055.1 hypothetical protein DEU42_113155 [Flavobacterium sp. AG291]
MIKNSAYIRLFTPGQLKALQAIAAEYKIKTAKKVLLFTLTSFIEHKQEIARLKRIIEYKKKQIEKIHTIEL